MLALSAGCTDSAGRAGSTSDALRPLRASCARRAGRARRPWRSRVALVSFARKSPWNALRSLRTDRTLCAGQANRPLRTRWSHGSVSARWSVEAGCSRQALSTLSTLCALRPTARSAGQRCIADGSCAVRAAVTEARRSRMLRRGTFTTDFAASRGSCSVASGRTSGAVS